MIVTLVLLKELPMRRIVLPALLVVFLTACQTLPTHRVHHRALDNQALFNTAQTTVVLPLHVEVKEMSAGGVVEVVPGWTDKAKGNIKSYLHAKADSLIPGQWLVEIPPLTQEQEAAVGEHTSLAKTIWATGQVYPMFGGPAWVDRMKKYDYSVGPGMAFLAEATGAEQALLIIGEDVHSTSGRKAMFVIAAAFGVGIPLGHKVLAAMLIDLRTGDVLWTNINTDVSGTSLLESSDVATALDGIFQDYPDVEGYRKFVKNE